MDSAMGSFKDWCIDNEREDILNLWDYSLNKCSPDMLSRKSHYKAYFSCGNDDHDSKQVALYSIHSNTNIKCVKCNSFEQWCLDNEHKDYLDLWDYELNDRKPDEVMAHTTYKAYFKCPSKKHNSFKKELQVVTRDKSLCCSKCDSFAQWCLDHDNKHILDLWDYELNKCSPYDIGKSSSSKMYFMCGRGIHKSYKRHISVLTRDSTVTVCKECNSFGQHLIDMYGEDAIEKYWSNKNKQNPFSFAKSSDKSVWILCQNDTTHGEYKTIATHFYRGGRCPICASKKVISGINDIATTHPHLVKYFVNEQDAYLYSYGSNKTILSICPNCSSQKKFKINDLSQQGYSCNKCSDGISYPEKFMYSFLSQIACKFDKQLSHKMFEWCGEYRYDFYIQTIESIIETHGGQHYSYGFDSFGGRTVEEEQLNDKLKKSLALSNGIKHYVELDCRHSDMEWIRQSIMNSELPKLLNFKDEDIDWVECGKSAMSSKVIEACKLWNEGYRDVKVISSMIDIVFKQVTIYLKKCAKLGLCDYDPIVEQQKGLVNLIDNSKKVIVLEDNKVFNSITELCKKSTDIYGVKFDRGRVSKVCNGKQSHHNKYHFKFLEDIT